MRRRSVGALAGLLILIPALAAFGSTQTRYIKDRFDSVGYSGSNGDLPWSGPWTEDGDAFEEGAGPGGGQVRVGPENCAVDENCAHFEGQGENLNASLKRFADLSNHVYADTCFYLKNVVASQGGTLEVKVTGDGGSSWDLLDSFSLQAQFTWHDALFIPDQYYTEGFGLKLVVSSGAETVLTIDDVEIKGTVDEAGSTTTSTVPSTATTKRATTTTKATTTTSLPASTTSTTTRPTSTTTVPSTTTTVSQEVLPLIGPTVPPNSGIRDAEHGLLARYDSRSFGGGGLGIEDIEVLGVEVTADFSIVAEAFGAARIWVALLALVMAAAVVSGMDWRRTRKLRS